jgi:hypothetical protein
MPVPLLGTYSCPRPVKYDPSADFYNLLSRERREQTPWFGLAPNGLWRIYHSPISNSSDTRKNSKINSNYLA